MAVSIQQLRFDVEFKGYNCCRPGGSLLVRCGWMRTEAGRHLFIESINNVKRIVPEREYNAMVREATTRVDNPYADDLTEHYAHILADWAE